MPPHSQTRKATRPSEWFASWQIPCPYRLAHLLEGEHVVRNSLAISKLVGPIGSFRIEIVEQTSGAFAVGVLTDVPGLLSLIDVAALIELNDLVVRAKVFVGGHDIG